MDQIIKEYIDARIKSLEGMLVKHTNNIENPHTENSLLKIINTNPNSKTVTASEEYNSIKLAEPYVHPSTHPASMIVTDPSHRFVTDLEIATFDAKIDKTTLTKELNTNLKSAKAYLNARLDNLINNKNMASNLRLLSSILKDDISLDRILEALSNKADKDEFDEHINNENHLSATDKELLDFVAKLITNGTSDWDAKDGDLNCIAHKPESLPANGGNADTISGYEASDLLKNKRTASVVIASSKFGFDEDDADYICDGENDGEVFQYAIDSLSELGGTIYFREGNYFINEDIIPKSNREIIICGSGNASCLDFKKCLFTLQKNITVKDLNIKNCVLTIYDNDIVENIKIEDSSIIINGANSSKLMDCRILNSGFTYMGAIFNNIIKDNLFQNTSMIQYVGGNNVIKDNLII